MKRENGMKKAAALQLRHLENKHRSLDTELGLLMSQSHLTPREYQQARELKKRKLMAKDGIAALISAVRLE
jgi:hypothetical protein